MTDMKLIIQIPCLNEEKTLPETIADIPRQIDGIDRIEILIIDDGSTDKTVEVAKELGVDHIVVNINNIGLARTFRKGIDACLKRGADIIVNTDGDHQYEGKDIPRLIQPILEGKADIVIGDRQTQNLSHFSSLKRNLQKLGSRVVSFLSNVNIPDATSGFRAYSRDAALRLNVFSKFSYTLETIIQAGSSQMAVAHVPVRAYGPTRTSRLFSNMFTYLKRSSSTILRVYALYEPLRTLFYIGGIIFAAGLLGMLRFVVFWFIEDGGHVQSLIVSAVLLIIGFQVWILGIIADLISVNRQLSEEILYRARKQEISKQDEGAARARETSKWPVASEKTGKRVAGASSR